jgi:hypothetical protein
MKGAVDGPKMGGFLGFCNGISRRERRESNGYFIARKCVDRGGVFGRMRGTYPPFDLESWLLPLIGQYKLT